MSKQSLLVVDDDASVRYGVQAYLTHLGYDVIEAGTLEAARGAIELHPPDAAIVDFQLPDGDALELFPLIQSIAPELPVLLLTGHGTIDLAVRAMQAGADHVLTKPIEMAALAAVLERAIENRRIRRRQVAERVSTDRRRTNPFIGRSHSIRGLSADARRVLDADTPILILGPTGCGKGVLASWIHENGARSQEPFVDINCASLSREFLETELFGHRKGSFTGAVNDKPGLLEIADRGTVFLDEIGDMDPAVQPKLLKVVEEGRFRRLGDLQDRAVDVRIIAATHHDLASLTREKRFREDLYYRINTYPLHVPPLRERREDLPMLAARIAEELAAETGRGDVEIVADAIEALMDYDWPGNIRELRNVLERALLIAGRPRITREDLRLGIRRGVIMEDPEPAGAASRTDGAPPELTLGELERRHILRVFESTGGRVEEASRRLGIPRSTLYQKLREMGIPLRR